MAITMPILVKERVIRSRNFPIKENLFKVFFLNSLSGDLVFFLRSVWGSISMAGNAVVVAVVNSPDTSLSITGLISEI